MRSATRIQRLAQQHERRVAALRSTYVSVQGEAELPGVLAQLGTMGYSFAKVYIGISPDDWDSDNATQTTNSTIAE